MYMLRIQKRSCIEIVHLPESSCIFIERKILVQYNEKKILRSAQKGNTKVSLNTNAGQLFFLNESFSVWSIVGLCVRSSRAFVNGGVMWKNWI